VNYKAALLTLSSKEITPKLIAKADSGATKNYFPLSTRHQLHRVTSTSSGPTVRLADHTPITATAKGILPLSSHLSDTAKTTHLFFLKSKHHYFH
jgi:hypothetical protein